MRPEKLTTKSQEAFAAALEIAARRGSPELIPEHLLVAMLAQEDGVARPLVQKAAPDVDEPLVRRSALDEAATT